MDIVMVVKWDTILHDAGWDILCRPSKYGQYCHRDCPKGCLTCASDGGCLLCNAGYIGIKCNCLDGCYGNKCDRFTGKCNQCKPFFKWPCLECVDGKWGKNCEKDCSDKCLSCISDTNCTKCKDGNYFSDGKCLDCSTNCQNISCNAESGVCNFGCNQGYWGKFCDKHCPDNCFQNKCNVENGMCMPRCKDHDKACDKTVQCVDGKWESRCEEQCSKNCSYCDSETGHCLQCKQNTFYGSFCNQECSETCIDRVCNFGKCKYGCKTGYYGESCQNVCSKSCFKQCDAVLTEASSQDKERFVLKSDDTINLLLFVAVVGVYAIVITVALIRNRIKQRREGELNEDSGEFAENEYEPTASRNAINSDHMYAIPEETTSECVPLGILENTDTLPSYNSTEDMNMYTNPVYADTKTTNEYEEMLQLICTSLLLISGKFVQSFCPKGCKCEAHGYCYDCEMGYYMMQNETCYSCSKACHSCSSVHKCKKCDIGHYINSSFSCLPCSTGCTYCLTLNTCLQCNTGYFRNGYMCNKCTWPCKTCTFGHNCITCNDGFKLNGTFCQKCPKGYFESSNSCAPCPNNCASCLMMNECTQCKQGIFGKTCDHKCSLGCKDNVCEQNTGNCVCKENYAGNNCSLCKPSKYGQYCHRDCPNGCLTCDSDGGCLVCQSPYFGIKCICSYGCLDNKCNRFTGQCFQCKPFFKWPCLNCIDGKWGKNCENDCPDKCISCSSKNSCTKCQDGNYFSDGKCLECSINCQNRSCNADSSYCIFGCKPGYWGKFCIEQCPKLCSNRTCNIENGACSHGSNDSSNGHDQSYDNNCSTTCIDRQCDSITGRCTLGCEPGYYGDTCKKQCSSECQNFACNREKGSCNIGKI
ncbi:cell death abnormality protein 1-like [Ruditapes philippinarum]|uniref:cell death abnormality protein 1-like n=1 Tax=Ruditapes philippinarum TaxID=129788 RepID=UPI00295BACDF|nr:cell death abnormality protein 1-like [Ruditapes philippinarum]